MRGIIIAVDMESNRFAPKNIIHFDPRITKKMDETHCMTELRMILCDYDLWAHFHDLKNQGKTKDTVDGIVTYLLEIQNTYGLKDEHIICDSHNESDTDSDSDSGIYISDYEDEIDTY